MNLKERTFCAYTSISCLLTEIIILLKNQPSHSHDDMETVRTMVEKKSVVM
jgi:hypothetical protein